MQQPRTLLQVLTSRVLHQQQRQYQKQRNYSTIDFISANDAEFNKKTPTSHTPIFSQALMQFFTRPEHVGKHFNILDMTFGTGSHTCYILDQFRRAGVQGTITVYAADCDPEAYDLARRIISERAYDAKTLVPIKSNFKELEPKLVSKGLEPASLSGILIDTGISSMQWANQQRGFCHLRDGILDLRLDPFQNTPKGYDVLQNIDEASLIRLLRAYGQAKQNAKHIATAILEARFMNYEFKTVYELSEVLETAVKHATNHSESKADPKMLQNFLDQTITALRMFVNDEINQLDYALRHLAVKYLKKDGIVAVIAHNEAEGKVVKKCLKEFPLDNVSTNKTLSSEEIEGLHQKVPWNVLYADPPMPLPMAEQILNPRLKDSVMFAAQRI